MSENIESAGVLPDTARDAIELGDLLALAKLSIINSTGSGIGDMFDERWSELRGGNGIRNATRMSDR